MPTDAPTVPTPAVAAAAGEIEIDLKDPVLAAFLAWLVPGLGHWYQGRRSKALLFLVCILGTFMYGLHLGGGRVVYASWRSPEDKRFSFFCQLGVGLPCLPALVQARRFKDNSQLWADKVRREYSDKQAPLENREPNSARLWDWLMAPPLLRYQLQDLDNREVAFNPPQEPPIESVVRALYPSSTDELDQVQVRLHHFWELGTVFTMIAGLLNILAIYDAWGGPAYAVAAPPAPKTDEDGLPAP